MYHDDENNFYEICLLTEIVGDAMTKTKSIAQSSSLAPPADEEPWHSDGIIEHH